MSEGLPAARAHRAFQALPTLETVLRSASRYNVAIYPLDRPSDGRDGEGPAATLRELAGETDGRALDAPTRSSAASAGARADASAYYLLTYRSAHPADGRFLAIDVAREEAGRARARAQGVLGDVARRGAGAAARRRGRRAEGAAGAELDLPWHASVLIHPWFGLARGANGRTRITFVWEPVGRIPGDRSRRLLPARVQFKALSLDGDDAVRRRGAADRRRLGHARPRTPRRARCSTCRRAACACACRSRTPPRR